MEIKLKQRIMGILILIAVVIIVVPMFFNNSNENTTELKLSARVPSPPAQPKVDLVVPPQEVVPPQQQAPQAQQQDPAAEVTTAREQTNSTGDPSPIVFEQTDGAANSNPANQQTTADNSAAAGTTASSVNPDPGSMAVSSTASDTASAAPAAAVAQANSAEPVANANQAVAAQPNPNNVASNDRTMAAQPSVPPAAQASSAQAMANANAALTDQTTPPQTSAVAAASSATQANAAQPMTNSSDPNPATNASPSTPAAGAAAPSAVNPSDQSANNLSQTITPAAVDNQTTTTSQPSDTGLTPEQATPPANASSAPGQMEVEKEKPVSVPNAWAIQLGSFSDKLNAEKLVKKLQNSGFTAYTRTNTTSRGEITRVLVGPELQRSDAEKLLIQLQNSFNLQGIVVKFRAVP